MHDLPGDWSTLCAVVFLLGLRHGFDADHLAAIDGMTRLSWRRRLVFARFCGTLFSLGHGAVVIGIAAAVGAMSAHWTPPEWFDLLGAWISISFLLLIGVANLRAVISTPPGGVVPLLGIKGPIVARLLPMHSALGVAGVGALFALSFDTISQAALFAVTAMQFGGVAHALLLGGLFVLGMLLADGLNGWWIARLIARADDMAALASRVMGVTVAAVSLAIAALGVARLLSADVGSWVGGKDLAFGGIVVIVVGAAYVAAALLAHRLPAPRGVS